MVRVYGEKAFKFSDNAITVTIPFNRINLGSATQDATQDATQVTTQVTTQDATKEGRKASELSITTRIVDFCVSPKTTMEIADMLGFKERKSAAKYIHLLLGQGRLAMTIPEKPNSKNQKYISIK